MNKEKILENMRKLKGKRKFETNNKVSNIKYIGVIKINGEEKGIYLLEEEQKNKNGDIAKIDRYYTEDGEFLAGDNNLDQYNYLILDEKYLNEEKLVERLEALDKEGIQNLNEFENQRLAEIAKALGLDIKDICEIDEIDANRELSDKKEKEPKEEKDYKQISNQGTKRLNIKEETSANTNLKGETLAKKLGLAEKGINNVVKIARVSITSLNNETGIRNPNKDAFVAIKSDGTAVPLGEDILKTDTRRGNDPRGENLSVDSNGKVSQKQNTTSYLIVNGNGQEYLQCGFDETSGKEIKYALRSNTTGEDVTIELETQRTYEDNSKVREFLNDKNEGTYEPDEIQQRNKEHGECEEKDITNIDNDKGNDSHEYHINEKYIKECVKNIMLEDTDIADVFTEREVQEILEKKVEKYKGEKNIEEIVKETKDELGEESIHLKNKRL